MFALFEVGTFSLPVPADQKSKSKWSNGAPPNGALPNKHVHPPADMQLEGTSHQPHAGTATSKPSFARGPGPHVDSYMTKDKDEARRRERERMVRGQGEDDQQ